MQELAYELNVASARLARQECDAMTARTPDKPRYVVGALGPTSRTASISPDVNDPGARNVTYDELVAAYLEQANGLVDGGADVLLIETDLRHPQRQGGDLRAGDAVRGARPPLAGDDLRHDHRRLRAHAVRPGHRGVLALRPARAAAARRAELRARRQGDAALHRRALPRRRHVRLLLSRTPACPTRSASTTSRPTRPPRSLGGVRRQRLRQPRRRLLRHDARAHRRDRRGGRGQGPAHPGSSPTRRCGCPGSSR